MSRYIQGTAPIGSSTAGRTRKVDSALVDPLISRLFTSLRRPKRSVPGTLLAGEVVAMGSP